MLLMTFSSVLTSDRKTQETPDVNRLTREIKFARLIHGKSPFLRLDYVANTILAESLRLAFVYLNPFRKGPCLLESYLQGDRERRDFSPAPSGSAGRARRTKSRSSRSTLWITLANGSSASLFQS